MLVIDFVDEESLYFAEICRNVQLKLGVMISHRSPEYPSTSGQSESGQSEYEHAGKLSLGTYLHSARH